MKLVSSTRALEATKLEIDKCLYSITGLGYFEHMSCIVEKITREGNSPTMNINVSVEFQANFNLGKYRLLSNSS